jgi:hypothetical protein
MANEKTFERLDFALNKLSETKTVQKKLHKKFQFVFEFSKKQHVIHASDYINVYIIIHKKRIFHVSSLEKPRLQVVCVYFFLKNKPTHF